MRPVAPHFPVAGKGHARSAATGQYTGTEKAFWATVRQFAAWCNGPGVRQAQIIDSAPEDGPLRQGSTPAEARHADQVKRWWS